MGDSALPVWERTQEGPGWYWHAALGKARRKLPGGRRLTWKGLSSFFRSEPIGCWFINRALLCCRTSSYRNWKARSQNPWWLEVEAGCQRALCNWPATKVMFGCWHDTRQRL